MGHEKSYVTEAGEPAGHCMRLRYIFFPTPEGGGKTWLGGELGRDEQRLSRTGVCVDLEGSVVDQSEGVFACLSPPSPTTRAWVW
jgi:hypothetical protein